MLDKLKNRIAKTVKIEDHIWEEVKKHHKVQEVKKNEILVRYNEMSKDVFFINSGAFKVYQITENGNRRAIWFHFADVFEFMACLDSYFMDEYTKYELVAIEDAVVIKFNKQRIDDWIKNHQSFNYFFVSNIIDDFVTIYEARSYLLSYSSIDFLKYTQQKFPFILNKLPDYHIADFIGVSPEWYSKLQKKLKS